MTPSFVLDASIALAWCFEDEATTTTKELLGRMSRDAGAIPSLWFLEVTNALVVAERKKRITSDQTAEFIRLVNQFDLQVDDYAQGRVFTNVLDLAREHTLSAYDALYLDLARRRDLPLATLDRPLRTVAGTIGVPLIEL